MGSGWLSRSFAGVTGSPPVPAASFAGTEDEADQPHDQDDRRDPPQGVRGEAMTRDATAPAISCCYQPEGSYRDAAIGFLLLSDVRGVVDLSIA
jgi:hypothetical protein